MKKSVRLLLLFAALVMGMSAVIAAIDSRFTPVAEKQLRQLIATTPISSPQHALITARADGSGLQKVTYEQYTAIWKRAPNDSFANLRRGIAAQNYWWSVAFQPSTRTGLSNAQKLALFATTRQCLSKAMVLSPRSADALVAYGYFSWQFDNRMAEGLVMLRKAAAIAPKSARVHANLGEVYANPSGNAYNPKEAEREIKSAIALSPNWAFPRWSLVSLYTNTSRFTNAQTAMRAYLSVTPASTSSRPAVRQMQAAINAGLKKQ